MRINDHQNEKDISADANHQNIDFHFRIINVNSVIIQLTNRSFARSTHRRLKIKNNSQNISNITVINQFS